ncbi:MAG: DUF2442 domain-containing protein [Thiotrichaceae bacterium]
MYLGIKQVSATDDYQLDLVFENNEHRRFDVKPLLNRGSFSELNDLSLFKTAHISFDTVEWNNGLDLDPEYLFFVTKLARDQ